MPSDEQLDTIVSAIKGGTLDPKTLPPEKRQRLKDALTDYQTRKTSTAQDYGEALLTNKPTNGMLQGLTRYSPAIAAGIAAAPQGAALGAAAGTAILPGVGTVIGGALGGMGAAAIGGMAGEATRQAVSQGVATAMPRRNYPVLNAGQVIEAVAGQGKEQAYNELGGRLIGGAAKMATGAIAKAASSRLPAVLKNSVGIPEPLTQYVQKRGAGKVFTPANLTEGAPMANVGEATSDLAAARSSVGANIGEAELAAIEKVGNKTPSVRHILEGLKNALYSRGITDPKTAGLARGKEVGILNKLVDVLTPEAQAVGEVGVSAPVQTSKNLTLRQAVNAKRLIDQQLEFADKELSSPTEQLLKKVNHQLRESVRADMGPTVSKLWNDFGAIADAQDKLAEFTGTRALSSVQQRAVQSLRGVMLKNPKEVENIIKILGDGLPGGDAQARTIFDSIAAAPFTKGGIGSPSSTIVKTLTAGGLFSGPVARGAVRGSEALGRMAEGTFGSPKVLGSAALAALRSQRQK